MNIHYHFGFIIIYFSIIFYIFPINFLVVLVVLRLKLYPFQLLIVHQEAAFHFTNYLRQILERTLNEQIVIGLVLWHFLLVRLLFSNHVVFTQLNKNINTFMIILIIHDFCDILWIQIMFIGVLSFFDSQDLLSLFFSFSYCFLSFWSML